MWRPVASLSFALDFELGRLCGGAAPRPFLFHLTNVVVHALASALVAVLALRIGLARLPALCAGLVFAVHPLHSEAVANVYQRQELLSAAFGLCFLLVHRGRRPAWAGLPFLLALGSKESALGFVPIALALDLLLPIDGRRWRWRAWAGTALAMALYLTLRTQALEGVVPRPMPLENPLATAGAIERVATALRVQLLLLGLVVWPARLSSDYSFDQIPLVTSLVDARVLGLVALVLLAGGAAWFLRQRRPRIGVAVVAYAALFAVTSNLFFPIGTICAERLAYAPLLGACLLAAEGAQVLVERGRARAATVLVLLATAALAARTIARNGVWRDDLTLFRDQVATAPRSAKAHLNLGIVLQRAGDNAQAARELQRSLEIYPQNSHTWYGLGVALYNLGGDRQRVVQAFENALRHGPMHHPARVKLAIVLLQLGQRDAARARIEELARLAPGHPELPDLRRRLQAPP